MAFSKNISERRHWLSPSFKGLFRFGLLLFFLSLSILTSCRGTKPSDKSNNEVPIEVPIEVPKEAETLPRNPSRLIQTKEDVLRQIENNGLGIISIHPDTKNAPPTIFSPDAFPKARPEDSKADLKQ